MKKFFYIFLLFIFISNLSFCVFSQNKGVIISLDNYIINPIIYEYINRGIREAEKENSFLLIILDTPGGLLESTRKIVKDILNSKVPIIVYVSPTGSRATSAGVFIALSAHILAMAPSTHIGAAHPVLMDKSWKEIDKEVKKKLLNDTVAWIEDIANLRNRNASWATDSVKESVSVSEDKALGLKIIDLVVKDTKELLEKIDGWKIKISDKEVILKTKDIQLISLEMNFREKFFNGIFNPQIAYILLILGFFALLYEVTHPGFGFPGIFGIIALLFSFYAFQILPVNYVGLVLIILGVIFFIVELFTPTFGLFTAGGVACLILGSIVLFNQDISFLRIPLKLILSVSLGLALITFFLFTKVIIIQRKRPLVGRESLIGKVGVAIEDFSKEGKIELDGEIWTAKTSQEIKKKEEVIVEKVEGLKLVVRRR